MNDEIDYPVAVLTVRTSSGVQTFEFETINIDCRFDDALVISDSGKVYDPKHNIKLWGEGKWLKK